MKSLSLFFYDDERTSSLRDDWYVYAIGDMLEVCTNQHTAKSKNFRTGQILSQEKNRCMGIKKKL